MHLKLHVGHGKTGSSFLQSWLAINADQLKDQEGIVYPKCCPFSARRDARAEASQFSMGNGFVLDPVLKNGCGSGQQRRWFRRLLRQVQGNAVDVSALLFSCEPWARKLPEQWDQLHRLIEVIPFSSVDVLLMVRDPLDHAVSVYGQMVKRHGFTGGVDDWLAIYDFPNALIRFLKLINGEGSGFHLQVDHYGRQRHELIPLLKRWLRLPSISEWHDLQQGQVNRSLTIDELALMRWLNERDPKSAQAVGERLVNQLPDLKATPPMPTDEAVEGFVLRWQPLVQEINELLPEQSKLKLAFPVFSTPRNKENLVVAGEMSLNYEQLDCLLKGVLASRGLK